MSFKSKSLKQLLVVAFLIAITVIVARTQDAKEAPAARNIPGVNAPDMFPKGCVDCHKNYPEMKMDVRLSTVLNGWGEAVDAKLLAKVQTVAPDIALKGKHKFKVTDQTNIPEACNACHGKMKTAPPLHQLLHVIHLTGDKDNKFISMFQGDCTHCHKLDAKKGIWTVGSGKEADVK